MAADGEGSGATALDSLMVTAEELREPALVIAPHPDDEMLGCGGWILRSRTHAARWSVVYVTHRGERRRAECEAALAGLDSAGALDLDLPEGHLWGRAREETAVRRLAAWLRQQRPRWLFVPNPLDPHPDHRRSHQLVAAAVRGAGAGTAVGPSCEILAYEGLRPLADPNRWLDLAPEAEEKLRRLRLYASQESRYRLSVVADHLGAYRGASLLRRGIRHAESYHLFDSREYLSWAARRSS